MQTLRDGVHVRYVAAKNDRGHMPVPHDELEKERLGNVVPGIDQVVILESTDQLAERRGFDIPGFSEFGGDALHRFAVEQFGIELFCEIQVVELAVFQVCLLYTSDAADEE